MWRSLNLITAPVLEPLTAAEVYGHLRIVEDNAEKAYAAALIPAARQWAESRNGMAVLSQTWEMTLDEWWSGVLNVPLPPLQSIVSIKYIDQQGVEQTLTPSLYGVITGFPCGQVYWVDGVFPPSNRTVPGGIKIRFIAGSSLVADVPTTIRQALLLLIGVWFENREGVVTSGAAPKEIPFAVSALLDQSRFRWWR